MKYFIYWTVDFESKISADFEVRFLKEEVLIFSHVIGVAALSLFKETTWPPYLHLKTKNRSLKNKVQDVFPTEILKLALKRFVSL